MSTNTKFNITQDVTLRHPWPSNCILHQAAKEDSDPAATTVRIMEKIAMEMSEPENASKPITLFIPRRMITSRASLTNFNSSIGAARKLYAMFQLMLMYLHFTGRESIDYASKKMASSMYFQRIEHVVNGITYGGDLFFLYTTPVYTLLKNFFFSQWRSRMGEKHSADEEIVEALVWLATKGLHGKENHIVASYRRKLHGVDLGEEPDEKENDQENAATRNKASKRKTRPKNKQRPRRKQRRTKYVEDEAGCSDGSDDSDASSSEAESSADDERGESSNPPSPVARPSPAAAIPPSILARLPDHIAQALDEEAFERSVRSGSCIPTFDMPAGEAAEKMAEMTMDYEEELQKVFHLRVLFGCKAAESTEGSPPIVHQLQIQTRVYQKVAYQESVDRDDISRSETSSRSSSSSSNSSSAQLPPSARGRYWIHRAVDDDAFYASKGSCIPGFDMGEKAATQEMINLGFDYDGEVHRVLRLRLIHGKGLDISRFNGASTPSWLQTTWHELGMRLQRERMCFINSLCKGPGAFVPGTEETFRFTKSNCTAFNDCLKEYTKVMSNRATRYSLMSFDAFFFDHMNESIETWSHVSDRVIVPGKAAQVCTNGWEVMHRELCTFEEYTNAMWQMVLQTVDSDRMQSLLAIKQLDGASLNPRDPLVAEAISTGRHDLVFLPSYVLTTEAALKALRESIEMQKRMDKNAGAITEADEEILSSMSSEYFFVHGGDLTIQVSALAPLIQRGSMRPTRMREKSTAPSTLRIIGFKGPLSGRFSIYRIGPQMTTPVRLNGFRDPSMSLPDFLYESSCDLVAMDDMPPEVRNRVAQLMSSTSQFESAVLLPEPCMHFVGSIMKKAPERDGSTATLDSFDKHRHFCMSFIRNAVMDSTGAWGSSVSAVAAYQTCLENGLSAISVLQNRHVNGIKSTIESVSTFPSALSLPWSGKKSRGVAIFNVLDAIIHTMNTYRMDFKHESILFVWMAMCASGQMQAHSGAGLTLLIEGITQLGKTFLVKLAGILFPPGTVSDTSKQSQSAPTGGSDTCWGTENFDEAEPSMLGQTTSAADIMKDILHPRAASLAVSAQVNKIGATSATITTKTLVFENGQRRIAMVEVFRVNTRIINCNFVHRWATEDMQSRLLRVALPMNMEATTSGRNAIVRSGVKVEKEDKKRADSTAAMLRHMNIMLFWATMFTNSDKPVLHMNREQQCSYASFVLATRLFDNAHLSVFGSAGGITPLNSTRAVFAVLDTITALTKLEAISKVRTYGLNGSDPQKICHSDSIVDIEPFLVGDPMLSMVATCTMSSFFYLDMYATIAVIFREKFLGCPFYQAEHYANLVCPSSLTDNGQTTVLDPMYFTDHDHRIRPLQSMGQNGNSSEADSAALPPVLRDIVNANQAFSVQSDSSGSGAERARARMRLIEACKDKVVYPKNVSAVDRDVPTAYFVIKDFFPEELQSELEKFKYLSKKLSSHCVTSLTYSTEQFAAGVSLLLKPCVHVDGHSAVPAICFGASNSLKIHCRLVALHHLSLLNCFARVFHHHMGKDAREISSPFVDTGFESDYTRTRTFTLCRNFYKKRIVATDNLLRLAELSRKMRARYGNYCKLMGDSAFTDLNRAVAFLVMASSSFKAAFAEIRRDNSVKSINLDAFDLACAVVFDMERDKEEEIFIDSFEVGEELDDPRKTLVAPNSSEAVLLEEIKSHRAFFRVALFDHSRWMQIITKSMFQDVCMAIEDVPARIKAFHQCSALDSCRHMLGYATAGVVERTLNLGVTPDVIQLARLVDTFEVPIFSRLHFIRRPNDPQKNARTVGNIFSMTTSRTSPSIHLNHGAHAVETAQHLHEIGVSEPLNHCAYAPNTQEIMAAVERRWDCARSVREAAASRQGQEAVSTLVDAWAAAVWDEWSTRSKFTGGFGPDAMRDLRVERSRRRGSYSEMHESSRPVFSNGHALLMLSEIGITRAGVHLEVMRHLSANPGRDFFVSVVRPLILPLLHI